MAQYLELLGIRFTYHEESIAVWDGLSCSFQKNTINLLLGPSGSGKSSLLHLIDGLIPNSLSGELSGEILLEGESIKFIDLLAENAVNAAMQRGRGDEGKRLSEEWRTVIYSAILDSGTCGTCEDADGEEADDPADLPSAPNPECAGGANCRCMHVYVAASER